MPQMLADMPAWPPKDRYGWKYDEQGAIILLKTPPKLNLSLQPSSRHSQSPIAAIHSITSPKETLETLPWDIYSLILNYLDPVDTICLALTSRPLFYAISSFRATLPDSYFSVSRPLNFPLPSTANATISTSTPPSHIPNPQTYRVYSIPDFHPLRARLAHGWLPRDQYRWCRGCHLILPRDPAFFYARLGRKRSPRHAWKLCVPRETWDKWSKSRRWNFIVAMWCGVKSEHSNDVISTGSSGQARAYQKQRAVEIEAREYVLRETRRLLDITNALHTPPATGSREVRPLVTEYTRWCFGCRVLHKLVLPPDYDGEDADHPPHGSSSSSSSSSSSTTPSLPSTTLDLPTGHFLEDFTMECPLCLERQLAFVWKKSSTAIDCGCGMHVACPDVLIECPVRFLKFCGNCVVTVIAGLAYVMYWTFLLVVQGCEAGSDWIGDLYGKVKAWRWCRRDGSAGGNGANAISTSTTTTTTNGAASATGYMKKWWGR